MVGGMNKSVSAEISKLSGSFFVPVVYPIYIYLSLQILCKTVMARELNLLINHALVNFLDANWKDVSVIHLFVA